MSADLIERLARKAGFPEGDWGYPIGLRLCRFAEILADECARMVEVDCEGRPIGDYQLEELADRIRAKFKPDADRSTPREVK